MQKAVEAVYENGVLKPLKKLDLKEGQHFTLLLFEVVSEHSQEEYQHHRRQRPCLAATALRKGKKSDGRAIGL
jgi:predicted DNA-binding antitoxin AbrB/MazE fold protein